MKSVVFVICTMNVGGVEKALLGVVKQYLSQGWEVHVAMLTIGGGFLQYLPKEVCIHQIKGFQEIRSILHNPLRPAIAKALKTLRLLDAVKLCCFYSLQKFCKTSKHLYAHSFKKVPFLSEQIFDLAVAFAGPDSFIDTYVSSRIRASEKWGWIHFDITKFGIDSGIIKSAYRNFSRINIVSLDAKAIFDRSFPMFCQKTYHQPNIIDVESITTLATETVDDLPSHSGKKVILTVGRISAEKGQFRALKAIKKLIQSGVNDIQWWLVGDGRDFDRCKKYTIENRLENTVKFLGAKPNPYPYMANCDIYLQPSEHEGFCITLAEAKLFKKPIIATEFTGAKEQLTKYYPHIIVPHDSSKIADAIITLL